MCENIPRTPAPSFNNHNNDCYEIPITDDSKSNTIKKKLNRNYEVLIIGAGMAGLSAANHLLQNGCDNICILEARGRIGGRIISIQMDHHQVELGANWIHGVLGNPIFEIAVANGLVSVINEPKSHQIVAITENGLQIPFHFLQEIYEAYVCFLRRCDEYFLCQYSPPPDIHSVGEHINYEIEIYLNGVDDPKEKRLKQSIFNCLLKRETCITGCNDMNEIDLLELGSYTELQGGNIVLPNGYSSVLKPLTECIPKESIITKCPVRKIHWKRKKTITGLDTVDENSEHEDDDSISSDDSQKTVTECPTTIKKLQEDKVNISITDDKKEKKLIKGINNNNNNVDNDDDYPVRVTCEDGRIFNAHHVICTVPLGVLKQHHKTLFDPELPHYKQESIEHLMFGTVDKIYLEYNRPILSADISEVLLLWDNDKYEINTNSVKTEYNSNEYLSKSWYKKIYSFAKITDTLLMAWVSGREADYMETLTFDVIADKCTEILRTFLQDPFIPKPIRCVCTSWKSQPFTMGGYTSIPVGALQEDIDNLAQPLYATAQAKKPVITFAGEHTHSSFYSTVHGAYLSGRTAAQYLLCNNEPQDIILESDGCDLSAWIQGIALD